jgi:hypothetical protein
MIADLLCVHHQAGALSSIVQLAIGSAHCLNENRCSVVGQKGDTVCHESGNRLRCRYIPAMLHV